jgi:hypothetical protein
MLALTIAGRSAAWCKDVILEGVGAEDFEENFDAMCEGYDVVFNDTPDGLILKLLDADTQQRAESKVYYRLQLAISQQPGCKLVPLHCRQRGTFHMPSTVSVVDATVSSATFVLI